MANWTIDPTHSEVQFKVKHLMISTVTGSFSAYEGSLITDETGNLENGSAKFSAEIKSLSTGNEQRDGHVKSADFFDMEKFPTLSFESTEITKTSEEDVFDVKGHMTIRDTTHPVTLKAEYGGEMEDFYGNTKRGFEITGKINRKDFGLVWDGITEAGGVVLSDEVKLILNLQYAKEKAEVAA